MVVNCYAVFDVKAGAFLAPFFMPHDGQAIRTFSDAVQNPQTGFSKHPEDYSLHRLSTFDDASGEFVAHKEGSKEGPTRKFLANAIEFVDYSSANIPSLESESLKERS